MGPLWGSIEVLWGPYGVLWEPYGGRLGCSEAPMGVDWDALRLLWGQLGCSWPPMGVDWGALGAL